MGDDIEDVGRLKDEYEAALDAADDRRSAYHAAVRRLYLKGVPLREIADRLGMSYQRVHQIVGEEPPARKRRRLRSRGGLAVTLIALGALGGGVIAKTWKVMGHSAVLRMPRAATATPVDIHPKPRWEYDLIYRKRDGAIMWFHGRLANVHGPAIMISPAETARFGLGMVGSRSFNYGPTNKHYIVLMESEEHLRLTDRPDDVRRLFEGYSGHLVVDPRTHQIRARRDYRPVAVAAASVFLLTGLVVLATPTRHRLRIRRRTRRGLNPV